MTYKKSGEVTGESTMYIQVRNIRKKYVKTDQKTKTSYVIIKHTCYSYAA